MWGGDGANEERKEWVCNEGGASRCYFGNDCTYVKYAMICYYTKASMSLPVSNFVQKDIPDERGILLGTYISPT